MDQMTTPSNESPESEQEPPRRWTRRGVLKLFAAGVAVAGCSTGVNAWLVEPRWIDVTRPTIRLPNLRPGWQGARIAQLTDIHVGRWISLQQVAEMVELANASEPDLTFFTGDLVSPRSAITPQLGRLLARLKAKLGVFAVLGNHDHWTDVRAIRRLLAEAGIRELRNEGVLLQRKGDPLWLAGTTDLWEETPRLETALAGAPEGVPRLLMQHNPDFAEEITPEHGVDFMVCGHTHGGQVRLPGKRPIILPIRHRRYAAGMVQGPGCGVYTSRGLGVIGPGVRFNCRPELPVYSLARSL
jgi:hypothetical protein